jgi:hypothetical protein
VLKKLTGILFGSAFTSKRYTPRGTEVVQLAQAALVAQLKPRNWPEVERWLLELKDQLPPLQVTVQQELERQHPKSPENPLWKIGAEVTGGEYDVQLQAIWAGPSSAPDGYRVTLNCQVIRQMVVESPAALEFKQQTTPPALAPATPPRFVAKVECGEPSQPQFVSESQSGVGV